MNQNPSDPHLTMPEPLVHQLGQFRQRLWSVETLMAVAGGAVGLLATYLLLFLSDRLWDTPTWARLAFTVAGTVSAAWFAWYWTQRWVVRRRSNRDLAMMVQKHFPRLGDRLLGTVELAEDETLPPDTSPALCRAAMRQVTEEASRLDFTKAVPSRRPRQLIVAFAGLTFVVVTGWFLAPAAGRNALIRWIKPWSSVERYTFTRLGALPEKLVVPFGENFQFKAAIDPSSEWRPEIAAARVGRQPSIEAHLQEDAFQFEVPGQTRPDKMAVSAGDARHNVKIEPVHRPDLNELNVDVALPSYLQYASLNLDARNGSIDVLAGSTLTFQGRVTRDLTRATLTNGGTQSLDVEGNKFTSPAVGVTSNLTAVTFGWRDSLGLDAPAAFALKINQRPDQKPFVECRNLQRVTVILENEILPIEVTAEDDFGVREVGIEWQGDDTSRGEPPSSSAALQQGKHQDRSLTASTTFSPMALQLAPQKVSLRARATDYLPDRAPSMSPTYVIHIMGLSEHAEQIERKLDAIQSKLESLTRTEENLWDENKNLQMQESDKLLGEQTDKKLGEQSDAEKANAQQLKQLEQEMKDLIKEAMRNQQVPPEAMKAWAQLAQMMQQVAQQDMPKVSQSLQSAQQSQNAEQRRQQMQEATTKQNEILEKLKEAAQKMGESGEQLQAANFINRLKAAAKTEGGIGSGLIRILPDTIGLSLADLAPSLRSLVQQIQSDQKETQDAVRDIRDDLGHYLRRVTKPAYATVYQEMKASNIIDALGAVSEMIAENKGAVASQESLVWAGKLNGWAEMLQPKPDSNSSGSGGEPKELTPEQMELLLKLMQIRQQEEGIREHTRYLEKHKEIDPNYNENAKRLSRLQNGLEKDLKAVSNKISGPPDVVQKLDKALAAMADATELLNMPDTGGRPIGAETEVIELLGEAIQSGSGSGSGAGAGAMAMMMQMMGMGSGATPGGNPTGGDTTRATDPIKGDGSGAAAPDRTVSKAGGRNAEAFPSEFRDALQGFFNTMEAEPE